jgi:hypothetical protein
MACETGCFEKDILACGDIKLIAGLHANNPYYIIIKRPDRDNIYQFLLVADGDGALKIPESSLPAGLLTAGNYFRIELRAGNDYLTKISMKFNDVDYGCALIRLVDMVLAEGDESPVNIIE